MSSSPDSASALYLSPVGLLVDAASFHAAAQSLQGTAIVAYEHLPVVPYLLGHAIELSLKAFLCADGWDNQRLKGLGHNLRAGLTAAQTAGLDALVLFSPEEVAAFDLLNELYWSKELEYATPLPAGGRIVSLPAPPVLLRLSLRLVAGLRAHCFEAHMRLRPSC